VKRIGPMTEPWGTPRDDGNMKEEEEPELTEKDLLLKPVVRGTHDAETGSETIEENSVVNFVECSTEVEREKKSVKPIISSMVDSVKEVNERGLSRVIFAIR